MIWGPQNPQSIPHQCRSTNTRPPQRFTTAPTGTARPHTWTVLLDSTTAWKRPTFLLPNFSLRHVYVGGRAADADVTEPSASTRGGLSGSPPLSAPKELAANSALGAVYGIRARIGGRSAFPVSRRRRSPVITSALLGVRGEGASRAVLQ
jgi:hypothetical protein